MILRIMPLRKYMRVRLESNPEKVGTVQTLGIGTPFISVLWDGNKRESRIDPRRLEPVPNAESNK